MDLIQVAGKYPPPPGDSEILGVEGISSCRFVLIFNQTHPIAVSGVICETSAEAEENSDLRKGDRVMALVGGGGYAGI